MRRRSRVEQRYALAPEHVAPAELASAGRMILHYTGQFPTIPNFASGPRPAADH